MILPRFHHIIYNHFMSMLCVVIYYLYIPETGGADLFCVWNEEMMFVLFEHPAGRRDAFADIDSISRCHSECEAKDYLFSGVHNQPELSKYMESYFRVNRVAERQKKSVG